MDQVDYSGGVAMGIGLFDWLSGLWPKNEAQLRSDQAADLAKIAAVNPDLAAAGLKAGDAATAAYSAMHPAEAANYLDVTSVFGSTLDDMLLLAGVGFLVLLLGGRR